MLVRGVRLTANPQLFHHINLRDLLFLVTTLMEIQHNRCRLIFPDRRTVLRGDSSLPKVRKRTSMIEHGRYQSRYQVYPSNSPYQCTLGTLST